ncbi:hypothetical protein [Desulfosarcina ovata]|uniref:hypothetical protein n=1 Tax=Desulfosarcina ovata TaxID=83564 RepID=UPI001E55350E|nr:hypothetical protein [Desulfosarcina ovata]
MNKWLFGKYVSAVKKRLIGVFFYLRGLQLRCAKAIGKKPPAPVIVAAFQLGYP